MRALPFALAVTGLCVLSNEAAQARGDGKLLAQEACSACHQVTAEQVAPPLVASPDEGVMVRAPSFVEIALRCHAEGDLLAKIASPHYPMREQILTAVDTDAIARYIRSLAPGRACPTPVR